MDSGEESFALGQKILALSSTELTEKLRPLR